MVCNRWREGGSVTGINNMLQHATNVRNLFAEEHWFGVSVSTMLLERMLCTPWHSHSVRQRESSCRGRGIERGREIERERERDVEKEREREGREGCTHTHTMHRNFRGGPAPAEKQTGRCRGSSKYRLAMRQPRGSPPPQSVIISGNLA